MFEIGQTRFFRCVSDILESLRHLQGVILLNGTPVDTEITCPTGRSQTFEVMDVDVFHQGDPVLCLSGANALGSGMADIFVLVSKDFMQFFSSAERGLL